MKIAALCIKCGEPKVAPLAACPACKFVPETSEDRAASAFCSSVHQVQEKLTQLQQDLRDGKKIDVPAAVAGAARVSTIKPANAPPQNLPYNPELGRVPTRADLAAKFNQNVRLLRIAMWTTAPIALFAAMLLLMGFFDWRNYQTGRSVPFYYEGVGFIYSLPYGRTLIEWAPYEMAFHRNQLMWLPFLIALALPFWLRSQARKQAAKARES